MTCFPDVQKKAQAEIDLVVGPDRLPSFADRDSLPYIDALVKEVFRWNAVVPTGEFLRFTEFLPTSITSMTGVPHRVSEDDIHDGYYIPKGSLIIPNIWSILSSSTF